MQNKKHFSRLWIGVILILVCIIFSACSGESTNKKSDNKKDEKESIKIVLNNAARKFPDGLDGNKNPYMDYIKENTNLEIELIYPPADSYQERLNVIMTSEDKDIPDMLFSLDDSWVMDFVAQGALQPLDDLLEEHGQDLLKNIPEEAWERVRIDGKIYAVPRYSTTPSNQIMYVRKDWLDNVGLEPPTTLEEYEEVIDAFVNNDPNNSGDNDTIGLVLTSNLGRSEPFFGAFGIQRGQWVERNGSLEYSSILPETKEALSLLKDWYEKGLIDEEWALNTTANLEEKIANGTGGIFSANWYDTRGPIQTNLQNEDEAEWIHLEYPVGPEGHSGSIGGNLVSGYSVIPVTSDHAEAAIRMLNFMIGDGYEDLKFGFESDVWEMEDGEMITDFEKHNEHIYRLTLAEVVEPENMDYVKMRLDSLGKHFNLVQNIEHINKHAIHSEYLGPPTQSMGRYITALEQMEIEYFTNVIMGNAPLEDFDSFIEKWYEEGGQEITDEVNEWYQQ